MKIKNRTRVGLAAILFFIILLPCRVSAATPLSAHGRLSVKGTNLVDAKGRVFQMKGVSTHGLSWFPEYVSKEAFQNLRDSWGRMPSGWLCIQQNTTATALETPETERL